MENTKNKDTSKTLAKVVFVTIEAVLILLTVTFVGWLACELIFIYEKAFTSSGLFTGLLITIFVAMGFVIFTNLHMIVFETIFFVGNIVTKKKTFKEARREFADHCKSYPLSFFF